ncbi:SDR family oxidoreductase [Pseudomonas sp. GOM6]|uniref:SDR family oxidoreductase n=1 Tax=Pseudomonas sp. GOM6 TaxID=3036944 RepID=UPI0024095E8E|nr:SDR family oxidoreductase [Pseudomonas sp. GOM6]MDG1580403.1 SDR family oxidoreductase [Pseudomonas sp. GOM6]
MSETVLITGVSSGIGLECAHQLTERGYRVIGTLRRADEAERLRLVLGPNFQPLLLDVTDQAALPGAVCQVQEWLAGAPLRALVNNAGIASPSGPLLLQPLDEMRAMFEVNLFGAIALTQAFAPLLRSRPGQPARLINIGSVSGRVTTPLTGCYAATKHALEAVSDALRLELRPSAIDVVLIEPGPIRTPIWSKAGGDPRYADGPYAESMQALQRLVAKNAERGAPVERVGQAVLAAIEARRVRARYPLHAMWHLARWLPTGLLDRLLARRLALGQRP